MDLKTLKEKVELMIAEFKNNGKLSKENHTVDYKKDINISQVTPLEDFLRNFAKDIISFANADGGIVILGISEDKSSPCGFADDGLDSESEQLLKQIDLNLVSQKFEKITKVGISIDLQFFQMGMRKYAYILIEKCNQILIPVNDYHEYKLPKGAVFYRGSSKNEHANLSTSDFNRFLQMKANERSKEFMEIWSKLLPEMVDINPREVLILNPLQNRVYGFNGKDRILSGSEVEIDKSQNGVFNIILNAISAGEIGKITTDEGKPLYKIVGELQNSREQIGLGSLSSEVQKKANYKFTQPQLKAVMFYLGWVESASFSVIDPPENTVNQNFNQFIWIGTVDNITNSNRVFFSPDAINELVNVIDNESLHQEIFNKKLNLTILG